eukprot:1158532-Pelagomonas_calceolata.AAC.19
MSWPRTHRMLRPANWQVSFVGEAHVSCTSYTSKRGLPPAMERPLGTCGPECFQDLCVTLDQTCKVCVPSPIPSCPKATPEPFHQGGALP